jgi:hypothetical protein
LEKKTRTKKKLHVLLGAVVAGNARHFFLMKYDILLLWGGTPKKWSGRVLLLLTTSRLPFGVG